VFATGSTERTLAVIGRDCSAAFASLLFAIPLVLASSTTAEGQVVVLRSSVTCAGRFNVPHLESDADAFALRRMFWIGSVSRMCNGSSVAAGSSGPEIEPPLLRGSSRKFQAGTC
jgi:hypothetical protein